MNALKLKKRLKGLAGKINAAFVIYKMVKLVEFLAGLALNYKSDASSEIAELC